MNKDELIKTLEIVKAEVEWEQPLTYAAAIDEAIKCIKALDKACEKLSELTKDANIPELNVHSVVYSKEAWKEWLLKDEEV